MDIKRKIWKMLLLLALIGCFCVGALAADLETERQVYDYLTDQMGLPSAAACGVLANIEHESGFRVTAVGDGGTSYGLCQWHDSRYSALKTYCLSRGLDYQTVQGQMEYLAHELQTSYSGLLMALKTVDDDPSGAYRAAYLWCVQFERPADMENQAVSRGTLARGKYWNRYNGISIVEYEEEPLTQEEVLQEIRQSNVVLPQPPQNDNQESRQEEARQVLSLAPYIPRHRPGPQWAAAPLTSLALSVAFMPMYEEKREQWELPVPEEGLAAA